MHRHPLTMTRTTQQCRVLDSHTGGEGAWPQCSCPGHWTTLEPPGALKVPGHGISGGQPGQSGCYPLICLQPPSGWVEGACFHWTQGQGPGLAAHSPPHRACTPQSPMPSACLAQPLVAQARWQEPNDPRPGWGRVHVPGTGQLHPALGPGPSPGSGFYRHTLGHSPREERALWDHECVSVRVYVSVSMCV